MAEYEVEKILSVRKYRGKVQYLVRWKHYGPEEDTWETEKNLQSCQEALEAFQSSAISFKENKSESEPLIKNLVTRESSPLTVLTRRGKSQLQPQKHEPDTLLQETFTTAQEKMVIRSDDSSSSVSHTVLSHDNYLPSPPDTFYQPTNMLHGSETDSDSEDVLFDSGVNTKIWSKKGSSAAENQKYTFLKEYYITDCLRHCWLLLVLYICAFGVALYFLDVQTWLTTFGTKTEQSVVPEQSNTLFGNETKARVLSEQTEAL